MLVMFVNDMRWKQRNKFSMLFEGLVMEFSKVLCVCNADEARFVIYLGSEEPLPYGIHVIAEIFARFTTSARIASQKGPRQRQPLSFYATVWRREKFFLLRRRFCIPALNANYKTKHTTLDLFAIWCVFY